MSLISSQLISAQLALVMSKQEAPPGPSPASPSTDEKLKKKEKEKEEEEEVVAEAAQVTTSSSTSSSSSSSSSVKKEVDTVDAASGVGDVEMAQAAGLEQAAAAKKADADGADDADDADVADDDSDLTEDEELKIAVRAAPDAAPAPAQAPAQAPKKEKEKSKRSMVKRRVLRHKPEPEEKRDNDGNFPFYYNFSADYRKNRYGKGGRKIIFFAEPMIKTNPGLTGFSLSEMPPRFAYSCSFGGMSESELIFSPPFLSSSRLVQSLSPLSLSLSLLTYLSVSHRKIQKAVRPSSQGQLRLRRRSVPH